MSGIHIKQCNNHITISVSDWNGDESQVPRCIRLHSASPTIPLQAADIILTYNINNLYF